MRPYISSQKSKILTKSINFSNLPQIQKMKTFACATLLAAGASAAANGRAMVGTNIGGWQVIEPWITPSLFYRFLLKTKSEGVGID